MDDLTMIGSIAASAAFGAIAGALISQALISASTPQTSTGANPSLGGTTVPRLRTF